jgi:hypothetical protein
MSAQWELIKLNGIPRAITLAVQLGLMKIHQLREAGNRSVTKDSRQEGHCLLLVKILVNGGCRA